MDKCLSAAQSMLYWEFMNVNWFHDLCLIIAVRCMMYGFGDDQNPYSESVDILEDLVIEFITEMVSIYCQGWEKTADLLFIADFVDEFSIHFMLI